MVRRLMTREEWAFFAPFLIENRSRGGRTPADHRRVFDAVFWIGRTGSPWRELPAAFGNWSAVCFGCWTEAAVWDVILAALEESEASDDVLQMLNSTIVRAHQRAAGGRGRSLQLHWPFARWAHDQDPRDCRDFRVWVGIVGSKEIAHGSPQGPQHTRRAA